MVYQTYCLTCKEEDTARIEEEYREDPKKKKEEIRRIKLHKYIGETSRSSFERAREHLNDLQQLKPSSHMLRHALDKHGGENINSIRFGMEVIKFTRTSFERQILESVCI